MDCKEIKPVNPKGNQSWIFIGRTEAETEHSKLKLQYFGHLMQRTNTLEKTLMLKKIEGGRRRGRQSMRWMASVTWCTWAWVSSGTCWWTEKPAVLQSMGSQLDMTERLIWTEEKRETARIGAWILPSSCWCVFICSYILVIFSLNKVFLNQSMFENPWHRLI